MTGYKHPEWSTLINSHLVWARMRVERTLVQTLASQLSSTLILVWPAHQSWENSRANSRFSTLIYSHPRLTGASELRKLSCKLSLLNSHLLSSSFDRRIRVERTLVQILASQLSSTLTSFDRRIRVERTLVQTLASQLSSTLILVWLAHQSWENSRANSRFSSLTYSHPRLTGASELRELSCKLSLLNSHQLSSSFDKRIRVERTLVQTLASQLSSTLILVWQAHQSWENSRANSRFSTLINSHPRLTSASELRELSCKLSFLNSHILSSSFDQRIRVERTLVQTLASHLSSTLILVWPAHQSWENSRANSRFSTLINSHPRLTSASELRELSCKLSLLNSHILSSSFDQRMRVERTLVQTLASQLTSTLILVRPAHQS